MNELTPIQNKIFDEIAVARKSIKTDDYSMSIGELINLYKDQEIKLDPAFQRLFRWKDAQKTKLIESILIGIPIPEIFVAQKKDGTWHVVDGVQRLSTIFQLVGILKKYDPLKLTRCKYIPSFDGALWDDLPLPTQREFKKSKIRVNIILTENSDEAQYELFQRLNTGGTVLGDQEKRNCLILMVDTSFYEKLNELKNYPNFKDCLGIQDHKIEKEFPMELILRMYIGYAGLVNYKDHGSLSNIIMSDFIDKETVRLIHEDDINKFEPIFKRTFDKLKNILSGKVFNKFYPETNDFKSGFNVSVFEMISAGVSENIDRIEDIGNDDLIEKIKGLYREGRVEKLLDRGIKPIKRFEGLTEFSKAYFK